MSLAHALAVRTDKPAKSTVLIDAIQAGDPELAEFTGGEISGLPVHKFTEDGEIAVKSYAEAWFTDRAVDRMLARGILPIIPVKKPERDSAEPAPLHRA